MEKKDNYILQLRAAQQRFLTYDQEKIIAKFQLLRDEQYLYPTMLGKQYRLCRKTRTLEVCAEDSWKDANRFNPVMTLLDMLCDQCAGASCCGEIDGTVSLDGLNHFAAAVSFADHSCQTKIQKAGSEAIHSA